MSVVTNPYLFFPGTCEDAMTTYAKVLGGKVVNLVRVAGSPMESHMPPGSGDKIMHACLDLGSRMIFASDAPPDRFNTPQGFDIHIEADSVAEAERIFKELGEGGTVLMPLDKVFWAERFGSLKDRFGTPWMVSHTGSAMQHS